jgi:integrase/recombinase XerD
MIESLFTWPRLRQKQSTAPLLKQREDYLSHLLSLGISTQRVRTVATMLLHIMRLMELDCPRIGNMDEIKRASARWVTDTESHGTRKFGPCSEEHFTHVALKWFRFINFISTPKVPNEPCEVIVREFVEYMVQVGLYPPTIRTYRSRVFHFLHRSLAHGDLLSKMSLKDVDDFLELKRSEGCLPRTIGSFCSAFKFFFRYLELRRCNRSKIASGIHAPRFSRFSPSQRVLPWKDVRRLLNGSSSSKPVDLRASAILFLCSIYGLRSSEVVNLTLDDFDWINETFIVRRAKQGRIQQYPIQFEVGEIILRYLQHGRPRSSCRRVFLTLKPPYRPVSPATLWTIFANLLQRLGLEMEPFGAHTLRRACATELLRKGSSLQDIADFLGHRDLRSVSIYAKSDIRTLKKVAAFSLGGLR